MLQIWPAIDIRGGRCVRLQQGDYDRETVFGDDPAAMARHWADQGARQLHLVDLDGARDGQVKNWTAIEAIVAAVGVPCQFGGGVRDEATISGLLGLGLARLVVGTLALKQPDWFRSMCAKFPNQLVLGIDARDGLAATDGWRQTSRTAATELAAEFAGEPLAALVYTDIAADGMLAGPNVPAIAHMQQAISIPLLASGGVTSGEHVAQLAALGIAGCIIGRALYDGALTLAEAHARAAEHAKQVSRTRSI